MLYREHLAWARFELTTLVIHGGIGKSCMFNCVIIPKSCTSIPIVYSWYITFIPGNLLNIKDAYSHPIFYRGIDDSTGFRTRYLLYIVDNYNILYRQKYFKHLLTWIMYTMYLFHSSFFVILFCIIFSSPDKGLCEVLSSLCIGRRHCLLLL
jgi:hypothetical protein